MKNYEAMLTDLDLLGIYREFTIEGERINPIGDPREVCVILREDGTLTAYDDMKAKNQAEWHVIEELSEPSGVLPFDELTSPWIMHTVEQTYPGKVYLIADVHIVPKLGVFERIGWAILWREA